MGARVRGGNRERQWASRKPEPATNDKIGATVIFTSLVPDEPNA